jgi:hypothetical protein
LSKARKDHDGVRLHKPTQSIQVSTMKWGASQRLQEMDRKSIPQNDPDCKIALVY